MHNMKPVDMLEASLRAPAAKGRPALVAYLTGGYPSLASFPDVLRAVAAEADAVEIGVPFTDPMADGVTIQRSSAVALEAGVTLRGLLELIGQMSPKPAAPLLLMSYLNPLLALGEDLVPAACDAGISGMIVPDLPLEECEPLRSSLAEKGMGLVQLVTPVTHAERRARLCAASSGFVYAVTRTGVTGGEAALPPTLLEMLRDIRSQSTAPVLAGFGIRTASQVAEMAPHVDGVIVGSALINCIDRGEDPALFLRALRQSN